jgi:hypothetical protein
LELVWIEARAHSALQVDSMNSETCYRAPWCLAVKVITGLSLLLLLGISLYAAVFFSKAAAPWLRLSVAFLPVAILLATLPFLVRGFVLAPGELRVKRFGWQNRFALVDVTSIEVNPEALRGSIRLWGSGGLFGFFGWFRNQKLGMYRAYGTDPKLAVIIRLGRRTIVVTPENPEKFVTELESLRQSGAD